MAGDRAGAGAAISDEIIDASADLLPLRRARRPPGRVRARRRRHAARDAVRRPPADRRGAGRGRPRRRGVSDAQQALPPSRHRGQRASKGPFPVGEYAAGAARRLRALARVQVFGEVANLARDRAKAVYFELRDAERRAAVLDVAQRLRPPAESSWRTAMQVVLGRRLRLLHRAAPPPPPPSPSARPALRGGRRGRAARPDRAAAAQAPRRGPVRAPEAAAPPGAAALDRRGDRRGRQGARRRAGRAAPPRLGRAGWCGASRPCRTAAPRRASPARCGTWSPWAASTSIVVARGGGSVMDLMAFSDETLCRTVALLPVPVIASVGHHTDRTLIDDVAAVSCSTPTHAAETAVAVHCGEARAARGRVRRGAWTQLRPPRPGGARRAGCASSRARPRSSWRASAAGCTRRLRELRAAGRRRLADERAELTATQLLVLGARRNGRRGLPRRTRRSGAELAGAAALPARRSWSAALALAAHDPERTLARGYALVEDGDGELVTSAGAAREAGRRVGALPRRPRAARGSRTMNDEGAPTSPRRRGSSRSSSASTPARRGCARRSTSCRRAASWWSSARRSSRRWAGPRGAAPGRAGGAAGVRCRRGAGRPAARRAGPPVT